MDPQALTALRQRFPILASTTYMISNSLGAMPAAVEDELQRYAEAWKTRGVRAWHEGWWEAPVDVGDLIAPFLGVPTGSVAMHPNVSLATAVFCSCLDYPGERNRIVYSELNFPSLCYVLEGEKKKGAEVRVVPSRDGLSIETEDLLSAIDERTRLVPISHVLFKSAFIQDAEQIARRCREVGALLLLDVYQSAGVMPLELERWGVDAAVGGCLKWLCGGPGNCFLYVREGLDSELTPTTTGWQSDQHPFEFNAKHERVSEGAWRFLTGTPNVPGLHAARPGLEILGALDIGEIRQRSLALTDRLIEVADEEGLEVCSPRDAGSRGGTVTLGHPEAERVAAELNAADIVCDWRPGAGVRLSPHVYNTLEECERAVREMKSHAAA